MGKDAQIRVMLRVRPSLEREVVNGRVVCCVGVDEKTNKVYVGSKNGVPVMINSEGEGSSEITEFKFDTALKGDCTEEDVYNSPVREAVDSFLDGYNATIFAYGQSGSGKTHTITHLTSRILDTILEVEPEPSISIFQIYKENLSDLLSPSSPNLKLKTTDTSVTVEGATVVPFTTTKEAERLIKLAGSRRATGATNLNEVSSRSHLIIQLTLSENTQLNVVDLAGSEKVKASGATGERLEEAKTISSSLFHLIDVVHRLLDKSPHVPYRNSTLTRLLKESLGGDCRTVVIATVSPAQEAAFETRCTLKFATACGRIENKPKKIVRVEKKKSIKREAPRVIPWLKGRVATTSEVVKTKLGPIHTVRPVGERKGDVVFLLHGCPSSAAEYEHWFPALVYCKLWPIAIDQPGFGSSPGEPRKSRSEYNNDEGGPVDVTMAVMRSLDINAAHFMGYDWGAGIVLSIGLRHPLRVKSIVSMLPSYAEVKKGELATLRPKTLIAWLTNDQFHNWKKWQPLAKSIPKVDIFAEKLGQNGSRYEVLSVPVVTFLSGKDPFATAAKIATAPTSEGVTTSGNKVTIVNQVALGGDVGVAPAHDADQKAVEEFRVWMESSDMEQIFKDAVTSNSTCAQFARLPKLTPKTIQDGVALCNLGIWLQPPKNMDILDESPKYYEGRKVLVETSGLDIRFKLDTYMKYVGKANGKGGEKFVTHHGVIVSTRPEDNHYDVAVQHADGGEELITVSKESVHRLNQPHVFSTTGGEGSREYYLFEDGMRGSYDSPLVAGKVTEIAFKLRGLVDRLDFGAKDTAEVQMKCVQLIRNSLNTTTFATGVDRNRIGRTDDLGKIASYGQVQCHGGSSVLAFYLLPFAKALGIDVRYRGGYTFGPGHNPSEPVVTNAVEAHQWLELTLLPSCTTVVADVFLNMINVPTDAAYTDMMYPNGRLICNTSSTPVTGTDIAHC